jgi:hypothetical protein
MPNDPDAQLFDAETARSLLDHLLTDSRLYRSSKDYNDLLEFVSRLRNFAPFNAMLLQIQKPGLSYAASAWEWRECFGRTIKEGARPLLVLWPFGPVALVYDVLDTEGEDLPEDVASFVAHGEIDEERFSCGLVLAAKRNIQCVMVDAGDNAAGSIRVFRRAQREEETTVYRMQLNRNHSLPVRFTSLAHELGHLFLGHLGLDRKLNIPSRPPLSHEERELEAESVAYLVCARNGVESKSQTYLKNYVDVHTTVGDLDLYQVMRAAGQVETVLGVGAHMKFDKPQSGTKA